MHAISEPPIAPVRPHRFTVHGVTIDDPYHWLRDPAYPQVHEPAILAHLEAENRWFETWMAPHQAEVAALLAELKGRIREDDAGVPWAEGAWSYWWRFAAGAQYRDWYRAPRAGGPEQLILSEGAEAAGHRYFRLGALAVSPDGTQLAFGRDRTGDERFELVIRDLDTGAEEIVTDQMLGNIAWAADSASLLWVEASAEWRPVRVFHHRLGTPRAEDRLLFHEEDPVWRVDVGHTQDRRWLLIESGSFDSSEVRLLDAADPQAPARLVRPRQPRVRYQVDGSGDTLFIRTNDAHVNFRIATARADRPGDWQPLIDGADDHYLRGIAAFAGFLAISERKNGLDQIRLRFADGREHPIPFPEPSYTVGLGINAEADAPLLRLNYSSMVTPDTVFDYDVAADRLITRKVRPIPSGYDPAAYRTERLLAPARDGTLIPISIHYRADYRRDGSAPLHCYGYGAYGHAIPPSFSASRLSLVDRGFAYAILHIRGGDDLGYQWYLDGKLEHRANTFHDFIDATRALHAQGFGAPGRTSASGGSAGGWLMGYVANAAPELWRAIVAHVPFVDVLNTMLDDSLPLTPGEYPEWGDPRADVAAFHRLRALSPYENVAAIDYPAMLVTAGLHDPRVTYWEPAKWVARLRALGTGSQPLLLKTNMEAGHGGRSGRFEALAETAEEYAFLLALFAGVAPGGQP